MPEGLQFYNLNYRNDSYTAVRAALAPFTDEQTRIKIMNMVTDAALDVCGYEPCAGAVKPLTRALCALVSTFPAEHVTPLLNAVETHLNSFLQANGQRRQPEHLITELLVQVKLAVAERDVHAALMQAADLPGWQNVTAYYLLSAAWRLMSTATRHLEGNHTQDYIAEGLQRALGSLEMAVHEWHLHTQDTPRMVELLKPLLQELAQTLNQ